MTAQIVDELMLDSNHREDQISVHLVVSNSVVFLQLYLALVLLLVWFHNILAVVRAQAILLFLLRLLLGSVCVAASVRGPTDSTY